MKIIDIPIKVASRTYTLNLDVFGDAHFGARNCAENKFKKRVREVAKKENSMILLGGDMVDAIKPCDIKRFDPETFPDWMLDGDPETIRKRMSDVVG